VPTPSTPGGAGTVRPADLRGGVVAGILREALAELGTGPLRVVDAGGGTGGVAVPLAADGHSVTVVDPSPDSLAALERRAAEAGVGGRVRALQGDLDDLGRLVPEGADVVLCHRVLEHLDDPAFALHAVTRVLRDGGLASLLTANRLALVLQRALAGRFDEATSLLQPGPRPGPLSTEELLELVVAAGLDPLRVSGIRVVSGLVPGALLGPDPGTAGALLRLERAAGEHDTLRRVAAEVHVLARRPGPAAG